MGKYTRIVGAIFLISMLILFTGCSQKASEEVQEERDIPVKVATVTYGSLSDQNLLTGTIIPENQADVMSSTTAEITDILVKKGDVVARGDVLAYLDDFTERNTVEQQQVGLKQAQAGLKSAQNGKKTAEIHYEQAKESLKQAEASLAEAKKAQNDNLDNMALQIKNAEMALEQTEQNFKRIEILYEEGLASKQNYDDAKIAVENAKLALEQVKLNKDQADSEVGLKSLESAVEQARIGVRIAESSKRDGDIAVEQAQASVDQAKLAVEGAQKGLEHKTIVAPISGQIIDVTAKVGEFASPQAPFATIVAVDQVKVSVNVLPTLLASLNVGDTVDIQVDGVGDMLTGTISYISPLSSGSGLFTVEADLDDPDGQARPGMIASFVLDEILAADSILVPTEAIVQKEGLDMVFIVEDGVVIQNEVQIDRYGTELTAVTSDLQENDKVVTSGQNLLEDGDQVTVMEEE